MRDKVKGTYDGTPTYCPVNAYGECPYCDQCNICHVDDPQEDCEDWQGFWSSWDEWSFYDADEAFDEPDYDIEMGFDPYAGCYTDDC